MKDRIHRFFNGLVALLTGVNLKANYDHNRAIGRWANKNSNEIVKYAKVNSDNVRKVFIRVDIRRQEIRELKEKNENLNRAVSDLLVRIGALENAAPKPGRKIFRGGK